MATLIGDFGGADYSPFHSRVSPSTASCPPPSQPQSQPQLQQLAQQVPSHHRQPSGQRSGHSALEHSISTARPQSPPLSSSSSSSKEQVALGVVHAQRPGQQPSSQGGASRIPSPPESSSPSSNDDPAHHSPQDRDSISTHMASTGTEVDNARPTPSSSSTSHTAIPAAGATRPPPPTNATPSPASDDTATWAASRSAAPPPLPASPLAPAQRTQRTIRIRDLNHIQTMAQLDITTGNGPGILNDPPLQDMKFEISAMPISDIIEMVAALLTKITTTNDRQHDALNRNASQQRQAQVHNDGADVHASPFSASVLAFHGKNVPAITILSYLSRIHKYCPTTYEVFLSLLVYFDRMTERVNDLVIKDEEARRGNSNRLHGHTHRGSQPTPQSRGSPSAPPPSSVRPPAGEDVPMNDDGDSSPGDDETDEDLADSDDDDDGRTNAARRAGPPAALDSPSLMATYFVVDSFNIHRLIIAGVTCASKFFSDVFYTNSRYAKVGGLPLAELNHLELQFLILNDFRLAIPIEDLEAYATMLVEFYAREVVGQRPRPSGGQ